MRTTRFGRPSPAMVLAFVALLVALGGTSYAAIQLPANSVGAKQMKKNAVNSAKVKNGSLKAADFATGQLPATHVTVREGTPAMNRANAGCQPGERAVGGGAATSTGLLDETRPTPSSGTPTGWTATAYDGSGTADVQVWVVCAS
jgi:hypothetical protein